MNNYIIIDISSILWDEADFKVNQHRYYELVGGVASLLVKLGKELGKSAASIYGTLSKLRNAGYILKDEDNLLVLNRELSDLVTDTRKYLDAGEPLKFDFLFKFCVLDN